MDTEERHQVLDEVLDYVVSVSSDDREATRAAIVEYLRSRPEFAEAGVSDGGIVWGVFTDGGLYFHADNRFPHWDEVAADTSSTGSIRQVTMTKPAIALPAALQAAGSAGAELPRSTQATVLDALGPQGGDVTESVAAWLEEAGYTTTLAEGTMESLRNVSGDGVFLFNGHGGLPNLDNPALADTYALFSTTEIDPRLDRTYKADLQTGRMGWGSIAWDNNPAYAPDGRCEVGDGEVLPPHCRRYNLRTVYALTTAGIEEYWSFAENALVALGSCTGATLANTIHHLPKGGTIGAFVGFTEIVTYDGGNTMLKFFFDRMLGRNKIDPDEWPDLRPFDADSVGEYMERKGKAVDSRVAQGAKVPARFLVADVGPTVLVPSIGTMEVHEESNELFIEGMFGSESDTIQMCPNPKDLSACNSLPTGNWNTGMVVGKVEDKGPTSAGWVRVVVDGRKSNLVPLTEWRGQINYRASADALAPNLLNEMSLTVHLRADVHLARERPWDEPKSRTVEIEAVGDSWGSWSASGSSSKGGGTFTLKGSGDMPVGENQPDHEGAHFLFIGTLVVTDIGAPPELVDVNIHAHLSSDPKATLTIEAGGINQTTGFPLLLTDVLFGRDFEFDGKYAILDGEVESSAGVGGTPSMGPGKLSWDKMDAKHAPDVNDPPAA